MILTLDLSPAEEARLEAAAQQQDMAPEECIRQLLDRYLPALPPEHTSKNGTTAERDPAWVAHIRSLRGKYAHTSGSELASEILHRR